MKKIHLLIPTILITSSIPMVSMVGCGKNETNVIHVTGIDFEQDDIESWINETTHKKVNYTITPANATDKSVKWSILDKSIATVAADGTITPLKAGTTAIFASTNDGGFSDHCNLTVTTKAEEISIDQGDTTVFLGHEKKLTYTITPETTTKKDVEWKSSDTEVATIDGEGIITPNKEGTTTITVKTTDGSELSDQCTLTVEQPKTLFFEKDGTSTDPNPTIGYEVYEKVEGKLDIHIETSTDQVNWEDWDGSAIELEDGEKIYVRNTEEELSIDDSNYFYFTTSDDGKIKASGEIDSMINFSDLQPYCYYYMFSECTILTQAPELPATTLADSCYSNMFYGCTSLASAPELPATTLEPSCYGWMFEDCSALEEAPALPADTLAIDCYHGMFSGCTLLTTAPRLTATTLADSCYEYMFGGCTALVNAPELSATTLADQCYGDMFSGCTSLTKAPELPATTLANNCYVWMFNGCTALEEAPALPAENLSYCCYKAMFQNCTALTSTPELNAKNIADTCYQEMFYGCSSLTTIPTVLPATKLFGFCYNLMFADCSSLKYAPSLPATELKYRCYRSMFDGCTSLKIKELDAKTGDDGFIFTCPSEGDIPGETIDYMFRETDGTFTDGTPNPNKAYYWYT